MKRLLFSSLLLLAALIGAVLWARRPTSPEHVPSPPRSSAAAASKPSESPSSIEDLRKAFQPERPDEPPAAQAAKMRFRARTDSAVLELLLRDLRDGSLPFLHRCRVALVLGTLDDPRVQAALAAELQGSKNPEWTSLLLHALGAQKGDERDAIFDLKGSPYVYELAGLQIRIKTNFESDVLRKLTAGYLDDENLEVRRAAARALIHSGDHEDLRKVYLDLLLRERDDGIRSGHGFALAQWMMAQPVESPERGQILQALCAAGRADDAALRARTEQALKQTPMSPQELEIVRQTALTGTPSQQIWSLSILTGRKESGDVPLEATFAGLTSATSEPKVREYAVRGLSAFLTESATTALIRAAADPEWNVRLAAIQGLRGRGSAEVILTQIATSDPDERVRKAAGQALKR